jgi:hypothetical protein
VLSEDVIDEITVVDAMCESASAREEGRGRLLVSVRGLPDGATMTVVGVCCWLSLSKLLCYEETSRGLGRGFVAGCRCPGYERKSKG